MKKNLKKLILLLVGVFLLYFGVKTIIFLTEDNGDNHLNAFTTDGCSMFPDGYWKECCVEHDKAYWKGGTYLEKKQADEELKICVGKKGYPIIGKLMQLGVSIGGTTYLPTSFRWGYGWEKFRGYEVKK